MATELLRLQKYYTFSLAVRGEMALKIKIIFYKNYQGWLYVIVFGKDKL